MAKRAKKVPEFDYCKTFDAAMAEAFPGKLYKTSWNILAGSFGGMVTVRAVGDDWKGLTKREAQVGRAISNAIAAAREGLES